MDSSLPIGIFDSGVGGLTVFKQLREKLPHENIIYFGDTKRNPYGTRSDAQIIGFVREILNFMKTNKVKLAVAACNTITVVLDRLEEKYPFKIIGMSKGIKNALKYSNNKRIGIIATEATIRSNKHKDEFAAFDKSVMVFTKACPQFVSLVEQECFDGDIVDKAAAEYLLPLKQAEADVIVLACTHYPLLKGAISRFLPSVKVIDPAEETAQEVKLYLKQSALLKTYGPGYNKLYFSKDPERAKRIASRIIDVSQCQFEFIDISQSFKVL